MDLKKLQESQIPLICYWSCCVCIFSWCLLLLIFFSYSAKRNVGMTRSPVANIVAINTKLCSIVPNKVRRRNRSTGMKLEWLLDTNVKYCWNKDFCCLFLHTNPVAMKESNSLPQPREERICRRKFTLLKRSPTIYIVCLIFCTVEIHMCVF